MHLLIFKLSPLGDTVMFLPVVQALRRRHPHWRITVITTPMTAGLYRDDVPDRDLIVMERAALQRSWRRPWRMLSQWWRIRRLRPSAVLLSFDQSSVARFLAAGSGAPIRVGGAGATIRWQAGLTHAVPQAAGQTLAEWDWAMAGEMMRALGQPWAGQLPPPVLPMPPTSPASARPSGRRRVVIHPGASREYQRWLPDRFAALATALARDCDVDWIEETQFPAPPGTRAVRSRTLDDLIQVLAGCDLFIGNHSGPFHVAAAMDCPSVVPTGPTRPECDPPWHRDRMLLLRAPGLACLPCDHLMRPVNQCLNVSAPMACMNHWTVETMEATCRGWMAQWPRSATNP